MDEIRIRGMLDSIEDGSLFRGPDFWANIGFASLRMMDFEKAILAFDAALKENPNNSGLLLDLALAHAGAGHDQQADQLIERALESDASINPLVDDDDTGSHTICLESVSPSPDRIVDPSLSAWDRPFSLACTDTDIEATLFFSLKNSRISAALADQSTVDCVQIRTADEKMMFLTKGEPPLVLCYTESIGLNAFSSTDEIRQLMSRYLTVKTNYAAPHGILLSHLAFSVPMHQAQGMLADNKTVLEEGRVVAEIDLELSLGINSHTLKELLPWAKGPLCITRGGNISETSTVPYSASIKCETEVALCHGVIEITLYSESDPFNRAQVRLTANEPKGLIYNKKGLPSDWNDIRVALTLKD